MSFPSEGKDEGQFIENHGIVVDSEGNVYVVDTRNVRVQKFDSDGNFITIGGSLGCNNNQFLIPHDIAMDSEDSIYVTDSGKLHFRADYDCNQEVREIYITMKVFKIYTLFRINLLKD